MRTYSGYMHKTIISEKYRKLLAWLKSERERQDLSMRDLAEKLDVPHSFVGKIETAERRLDLLEYVEYCEALGIKPEKGLTLLR